jgi:Zn-dependent protease
MSWQDRDYNRADDDGRRWSGPLWWLLAGSLPLGTWFGVRVRAHVSLIIFLALELLFPRYSREMGWAWALQTAAVGAVVLFGLVLLHEFGHCVAARSVGGRADEVLLWPLGGLAYTDPPRRPWPTFVTVAGGPLVNVGVCLVTGVALAAMGSPLPLNPFAASLAVEGAAYYVGWVFYISYLLLLFNLLPIFPLDGGQMLQTVLWHRVGYYRSMYVATVTGMIGAGALGLFALTAGSWLTVAVAVAGFIYCMQRYAWLKAMGREGMEQVEWAANFGPEPPHRRHISPRRMRRLRRLAAREQASQARIDEILAKVSAKGLGSLTWSERRALRKETLRRRERDLEMSRDQ